MVSTIATSSNFSTAIENELNAKVDVVALAVARNLDAVTEGAQGAVSPATTAILRNVLVHGMGQVGDAIDGTPGKGIGQIRSFHVFVREGRCHLVEFVVAREELHVRYK
jgi:hypothetical protein